MANILIVDDVAANRSLLGTILRHQGHSVIEAPDGEQALSAARAAHPDLVVTDVLMPVMDGYELVRQMRLDPATRSIPVVFHTAHYGEREARELALASGVAWVLLKPSPSAEVVSIVERALAGQTESAPVPGLLQASFDQEHLRLLTDKLSEKNAHLRHANARLRALVNIGMELASESDADRLLGSVCVAARDLFGASYVSIGLVERRTVQRALSYGSDESGLIHDVTWIAPGELAPGVLGTVVEKRLTLMGDNPGGHPSGLQLPSLHPPVRAFVAAPVASPTHVYGWICLVSNEERVFSEDDRQLLTALSGQIGRVYEAGHQHSATRKRCLDLEREMLSCRETGLRLKRERDTAQQQLLMKA